MKTVKSKTLTTMSSLANLFELDALVQDALKQTEGNAKSITVVVPYTSKRKPGIDDQPSHLRGPSHNKYGGHQTRRYRTYGGTFGAADKVQDARAASRKKTEDYIRKLGFIE